MTPSPFSQRLAADAATIATRPMLLVVGKN
jgi:hypothetical protein